MVHRVDLPAAPGEPLPEFIPAGAQPAHRHRGLRDHVGVHAVGGVDDARHDDTPGARGPEIRHYRAKVLRLHPVQSRIRRGLGVTHAQLVNVDVAGLDPGPRELGEDLPPTVVLPTPGGPHSHKTGIRSPVTGPSSHTTGLRA